MGNKPKKPKKPPRPQPQQDKSWEEDEGLVLETPIGDFVSYPSDAPYIRFLLFRPGQEQVLAEFEARREAGERVDPEEVYRRARSYGTLMLAVDEQGFAGELYLDREIVDAGEVDTLVDGVCDFLEGMPVGPEGGVLSVCWTEEIADYSFVAEE
jgi:hypothetical protein